MVHREIIFLQNVMDATRRIKVVYQRKAIPQTLIVMEAAELEVLTDMEKAVRDTVKVVEKVVDVEATVTEEMDVEEAAVVEMEVVVKEQMVEQMVEVMVLEEAMEAVEAVQAMEVVEVAAVVVEEMVVAADAEYARYDKICSTQTVISVIFTSMTMWYKYTTTCILKH